MSARDLVVHVGDRVAVSGRYVARNDGDWLDLAIIDNLLRKPPDWKSSDSVKLSGQFDPNAVPKDFGPNEDIIRGFARVIGTWLGDTFDVESQGTAPRPQPTPRSELPCPTPPGGWDTTSQVQDLPELDELRASGAIVRDQWTHQPSGALVLRVAASDIETVRRALDPVLPRRLCVVRSRFSAHDVRRMDKGFRQHFIEWKLAEGGTENLDRYGQPYGRAALIRVSDDLAEWVDTLPDGLFTLEPTMVPA